MNDSKIPIYDGHNDTILHYSIPKLYPDYTAAFMKFMGYDEAPDRSFLERGGAGHIDLPRAREGGLAGGFWAISPFPESLDDKSAGEVAYKNWVRVLRQTWK